MNVNNIFPVNLLEEMIEEGYINKNKHPSENLFIYNYSKKCQYDNKWNTVTLNCRGLILDDDYNIIARPFRKFFNLEEHINYPELGKIPNSNYKIFDKLDGSLGILYKNSKGDPCIASRGSFTSDQANFANDLIKNNKILYNYLLKNTYDDKTYCFEIIYPENRIIVDYGDRKDIVLIGLIDNKTGLSLDIPNHYPFPKINGYKDIRSLSLLKSQNLKNKEGYIIKYDCGFIMKIKFENYKFLHYIKHNITSLTIWEKLSKNVSVEEIIDAIPDECYDWVKDKIFSLKNKHRKIKEYCLNYKKYLTDSPLFDNRKEIAYYIKNNKYKFLIFKLLDSKDIDSYIWKIIKPSFETPF